MTVQAKDIQVDLYQKIKRHHGAISQIAVRAGVHRNNITRILQGQWHNTRVLAAAAEILSEIEAELAATRKLVERAVSQQN